MLSGAWQAIREVFPGRIIKGCVFHWTQAVYRKVLQLGLSTAYVQRRDKYEYIRKLLALPFLPSEHIVEAFKELERQALGVDNDLLKTLVNYIRKNWIESSVWRPENWSAFRETIRTNNDVEGMFHVYY